MTAAVFSIGRRRQQMVMRDKLWHDDRPTRRDILFEVWDRAVALQEQNGREVFPRDVVRHGGFIDACSPSA